MKTGCLAGPPAVGRTGGFDFAHLDDLEHPEFLDDYQAAFGTRDLDAVAEKQLEVYRDFDDTPPAVTLLQIALMKMVLIRRVSHAQKSFNSQWGGFR